MANFTERFWHGTPYNDVPSQAGVTVERATVAPGALYARAVVVHQMTPAEAGTNHNVYLDLIDENGQRVKRTTFNGYNNGIGLGCITDKPDNEPRCNMPMYSQDTLAVWVDKTPVISQIQSDRVTGLSTRWPGQSGSTYGHVSFYIIFQLTKAGVAPPPPPPAPLDCGQIKVENDLLKLKLSQLRAILGE